jgi:hypothetical protein
MRVPVESVAGGAAKQIVVSIFGEVKSNCRHEFPMTLAMSWRALMTILSFLLVNPPLSGSRLIGHHRVVFCVASAAPA